MHSNFPQSDRPENEPVKYQRCSRSCADHFKSAISWSSWNQLLKSKDVNNASDLLLKSFTEASEASFPLENTISRTRTLGGRPGKQMNFKKAIPEKKITLQDIYFQNLPDKILKPGNVKTYSPSKKSKENMIATN